MKNLKKKLKKAFKITKKTNKIKNEQISTINVNKNVNNHNSTTKRIKSAETKTSESKTKDPVKLFIKKDINSKKTDTTPIIKAEPANGKVEVEEATSNENEPKEEVIVEPTEQQAKEKNQLDKRERMELYKKSLLAKPPASSINEAFDLINNTLIEIEEKYGPNVDNRTFYFSKRYGRMFPLNREKLKFNAENGKNEMITVGFTIYINKNGSFEFWSKNPKDQRIILAKSGAFLGAHRSNMQTQLVI